MCWRVSLEYQTGKSLKRANRLSSDFFLFSVRTVSQASTISAEAITTKKSRKNIINHRVLHSPPIDLKELRLVDNFQNSRVLICLPLYAIFLNKSYVIGEKQLSACRITLFITCTPRPEAQLSTCLVAVKDEDGNRVGGVVHASRISIT